MPQVSATLRSPMPARPDLKPTPRDPRKLRNTALGLVVFMVVGGWLVMKAYEKWSLAKSKDDRPSIVHRILPERSLRMVRQDGQQADLIDLRGKVFVLNVIHTGQAEDGARTMAVMKRLSERFSDQADFRLVTLILNPGESEGLVALLKTTAAERGIALPQWWLGSNEPKTLQTFIRKELKPNAPPEEIDGRWVFDTSIVLVDRNGHLRRAVVPQKRGGPPYIAPFDFDEAAKWDEEGKKTGTELSNFGQLEQLLNDTIDKLLAESYQP